MRAGFSVESGKGYEPAEPFRSGNMKRALSGFVAVDTRFGPVFLAVGGTRGGSSTLFLFLGPYW